MTDLDALREQRRAELYALLGDLPPRERPIDARYLGEEVRDTYVIEHLLLDLNGMEPVPAYFIRPKVPPNKPTPVILYNHSHGGNYALGKDELLTGREYLHQPPYAEALTALGYSVLCIDAWGFGERRGRSESEIFKHMLWSGQVMWGMMVYDSLQAIAYLKTRHDVDPHRIGTIGMSMGSTMAWWVAALEPSVKVCVDICCLTDFHSLIDARGLDQHGIYYYVPNLLKRFSTADINALIAPRPHLALAGMYDRLTPLDGLQRVDAAMREVYEAEGAADRWKLSLHHVGHLETAAMRAEALSFLQWWL
ncbi:MAG: dienelactone hydrolase family protein [Alicyclobacillus sp.]|nr:dienelactone hydrolase family protein [Alicyclobacillus sp.]